MRRRVGNHQDIDEEKPEIVMNLVKLQPVEHVSIQVLCTSRYLYIGLFRQNVREE